MKQTENAKFKTIKKFIIIFLLCLLTIQLIIGFQAINTKRNELIKIDSELQDKKKKLETVEWDFKKTFRTSCWHQNAQIVENYEKNKKIFTSLKKYLLWDAIVYK